MHIPSNYRSWEYMVQYYFQQSFCVPIFDFGHKYFPNICFLDINDDPNAVNSVAAIVLALSKFCFIDFDDDVFATNLFIDFIKCC